MEKAKAVWLTSRPKALDEQDTVWSDPGSVLQINVAENDIPASNVVARLIHSAWDSVAGSL